jgi:hypothetical protein
VIGFGGGECVLVTLAILIGLAILFGRRRRTRGESLDVLIDRVVLEFPDEVRRWGGPHFLRDPDTVREILQQYGETPRTPPSPVAAALLVTSDADRTRLIAAVRAVDVARRAETRAANRWWMLPAGAAAFALAALIAGAGTFALVRELFPLGTHWDSRTRETTYLYRGQPINSAGYRARYDQAQGVSWAAGMAVAVAVFATPVVLLAMSYRRRLRREQERVQAARRDLDAVMPAIGAGPASRSRAYRQLLLDELTAGSDATVPQ